MNTLFDYYVMLNYIIYKFYRRYDDEDGARMYAHGGTSLLLSLPLCSIHGFLCISQDFKMALRDVNRWVYAIPLLVAMLLNYLLLYRGGRYKEEFTALDKISDTENFARRRRNTKIFMITLIVIQIISLIPFEKVL